MRATQRYADFLQHSSRLILTPFAGNGGAAGCNYSRILSGVFARDGKVTHSSASVKTLRAQPSASLLKVWAADRGERASMIEAQRPRKSKWQTFILFKWDRGVMAELVIRTMQQPQTYSKSESGRNKHLYSLFSSRLEKKKHTHTDSIWK